MEFARLGSLFRERLFMAANRVGKTELGAYETTLHLTGDYPDWWPGRRFDHPVEGWAAGKTNKTTMDIVQEKLLGKEGERGTGMIPADSIVRVVNKPGLPGAADTITVRHKSGGRSVVGLKSYEAGRGAFEGTAKHFVWLDEEPEQAVYTECLYRTATTDGILYTTFTPLEGMSDVVKSFLEPDNKEAAALVKAVVMAGWDDVPHLTDEAKAQLIAGTPPHQVDSRTKGLPAMGAGAIYPIPESDIVVPPREIPKDWPRAFGMDVGWNRTAAVWIAKDPATNVLYLYHEHYRGQAEPVVHAQGIKAPGAWIPGVIDPASAGANQIDGRNLLHLYREFGLDLLPAVNAVETGIYQVWQLLSAGRLKVFSSLTNWISEYRRYHRDENGKLVKKDDHLMDATRYAVVSGIARLMTEPAPETETDDDGYYGNSSSGWMA